MLQSAAFIDLMYHRFQIYFIYTSCFPTDQRPPASKEAMLVWSPHGHNTTTTTLLQLALALAVLLCPLGLVIGQQENETQSPAQVLQDLLARYGDNSTITVPQLRSLLALLSQGHGGSDSESSNVAETPTTKPPKSNSSKVRTNAVLWSVVLSSFLSTL